jgi:hypothetical protein
MLTEICQYLHNYFDYERHVGKISIVGQEVFCDGKPIEIGDSQYFALFRQRIPLGVFQKSELTDKEFLGAVWLMDVPKTILEADAWAEQWKAENGAATAQANGPYASESFGGYSYSKGGNNNGKVGSSVFENAQFAAMLNPYRKLP